MDVLRDLHQGQLGIHQKIGRAEDALFVDIVLQALARLLFEELGQMGGADADALGDIVQIDLLPVVLAKAAHNTKKRRVDTRRFFVGGRHKTQIQGPICLLV